MKKLILTTALVLSPVIAFAHANHAPIVATCAAKDCTKEEIQAATPKAVQLLIKDGDIEKEWATANVQKIEQKTFRKGPEWVVTLWNENQKDQKKQRRYIFITLKGRLNGSNLTGE